MNTKRIDDLEAIARDTSIMLLASEGWAASWLDQPEYFKKLLVLNTDMEKAFRDYLRGLGQRVNRYVNWSKYHLDVVAVQANELRTLEAYDVNVLFDNDSFDDDEQTQLDSFIKEIYIDGIALGWGAQQALRTPTAAGVPNSTSVPTNTIDSPIDQAIKDAYDEHVEQLSEWLDKTTANEVVQSIQESLALGENQQLAEQRLKEHVDGMTDKRATKIANTESVRAFAIGENNFAVRNGAISKTWEALPGADSGSSTTPCLDNDGQTVDILDSFPSGDDMNPAHPYCRCKVNYNYADGSEVDDV